VSVVKLFVPITDGSVTVKETRAKNAEDRRWRTEVNRGGDRRWKIEDGLEIDPYSTIFDPRFSILDPPSSFFSGMPGSVIRHGAKIGCDATI
jgi:hypothetical protein